MTTPQIDVPGTPPDPLAPQPTFRATFYAYLQQLIAAFGQANTGFAFVNTKASEAAGSVTSAQNLANQAQGSATDAATKAAEALQSRNAAAAFVGAGVWVSGQSYTTNNVVTSPLTFQQYRAKQNTSGTIDPSADTLNWERIALDLLPAINKVLDNTTAVDVFVYDTSKDSDGGAWRNRTQHTSWYNEPLNTATRGSRREFPSVAVIVAEADKVTIYDGDDPALPMWMVFIRAVGLHFYSSANLHCVSALNGEVWVGSYGAGQTLLKTFSFVKDRSELYGTSGLFTYPFPQISVRNTAGSGVGNYTDSSKAIVNNTINDVAMTVLPDAPIDPATGLQVPTIAVATNGGVSVITDSGAVYDSLSTLPYSSIGFTKNFNLYASRSQVNYLILSAELKDYTSSDGFGDTNSITYGGTKLVAFGKNVVWNSVVSGGFSIYKDSPPISIQTDRVSITSTYNTGWMPGDIKGAFLADTSTTALVGGTDNDRSVNSNPLNVVGTIQRTPVATGAELVAYSGFSSTNYLEQPYNPDLDFGTGDFCIMGWVNTTSTASQQNIFFRGDETASGSYFNLQTLSGYPRLVTVVGTTTSTGSISAINNGNWYFVCGIRRSGTLEMFVNGSLASSVAEGSRNVTNTSAIARAGRAVSGNTNQWGGSLALLRISATAPSAEQIKKIYEDEKFLFQENAACTLFGTSDAVTALAHDPVTDLLHVGTSQGRSDFQGLRRVSNTTDPVTTAISASNGFIVEE